MNSRAGSGRAVARWRRLAPVVGAHYRPEVIPLDVQGAWEHAVRDALARGVNVFLAAGGDGTVRALVECLRRAPTRPPLGQLSLGAAGLGSSNDFHKPAPWLVHGLPLRVRPHAGACRDVCLARYRGPRGTLTEQCFLVSASVGATAEANARYHRRSGCLASLARCSPHAAITLTALRTLVTHVPRVLRLTVGGSVFTPAVATLNAQKTPYIAGGFRFDTPVAADDGLLGLNLCSATTCWGQLRALFDLARGRFLGRADRHYWSTPSVRIESSTPFALELDGEVVTTTDVTLEVTGETIGALG